MRLPRDLGRYELLAQVGSGGTATVYVGRARGIGGFTRDVAVKVLHPHLREDPAFEADFLREGRLHARVRHPHVVPVLEVGQSEKSEDGVFLVMDLVDGLSLAALMRAARQIDEPIPDSVALRVVCDALAGLDAAHEATDEAGRPLGLVHRDVSPHNLLVGTSGVTQLADFGIARPAHGAGHTRTGLVKGKLPYMAPEQLRGRALDRRTDVFAAGVVAWELLAREALYAGEDEAAVLLKIASEAPPALRSRRPDLPPAVLTAVDRALDPRPEARWATARAFREALVAGAAAIGGLADASVVAAFVADVGGAELERLRGPLRQGSAVSAPLAHAGAREGARAVAPEAPVRPGPAGTRYALAAAAVILAAVAGWALKVGTGPSHAPRPVAAAPPPAPAPAALPSDAAKERPGAGGERVDRGPRKAAPKLRPRRPTGAPPRTPGETAGAPPMAENPYER